MTSIPTPSTETDPAAPIHNTPLVDTHCHLDMSPLDADHQAVLAAAHQAGVDRIITVGIDLDSSRQAVELAERHPEIWASVGVHPHNVAGMTDQVYEEIQQIAGHPRNRGKIVAYGEIGLDFVKLHTSKELQITHFRHQLQLAKGLGLPIIIHDREAHDQIMAILRSEAPYPAGGVMHCFSGDMRLAEEVMELGFMLSIPGIVTFAKALGLQEVARRVALSSLVLETDAPFLAPVPMRGKPNQPAFLRHTARKLAELRDQPLGVIARQTTKNAENLFQFDCSGRQGCTDVDSLSAHLARRRPCP